MRGRIHVIGAGLAGLAAAVQLVGKGREVFLHEASPHAGGRCRSYHDATLDLTIDNGNHLLLSANHAALGFLNAVGAKDALTTPDESCFPFIDLRNKARWNVRPNDGRIPWWVFAPSRRVPDTSAFDYRALLGILFSRSDQRLDAVMTCAGPLYERLWEPILLAGLNIAPPEGSSQLAAAMIRESLGAGGRMCRPLVARHGLSHAFVDPALTMLAACGVTVSHGKRLKALDFNDSRVSGLVFSTGIETLAEDDAVVLAVPSWVAGEVVPGLAVPMRHCAILNAHFKIAPPSGIPPFIGVIGATTEWIFAFEDRLSVTISGADRLVDENRAELAQRIWDEVRQVAGLDQPLPVWQIVKEKRATFAATPAENARRPGPRTAWRNLVLAGDWTATGLPATIEGAIRSGNRAAGLLLARA
jgi:squalene-associated FAD-dependent desaturase